jgi:hypothetical protein
VVAGNEDVDELLDDGCRSAVIRRSIVAQTPVNNAAHRIAKLSI